jgi:hypothetical protein
MSNSFFFLATRPREAPNLLAMKASFASCAQPSLGLGLWYLAPGHPPFSDDSSHLGRHRQVKQYDLRLQRTTPNS